MFNYNSMVFLHKYMIYCWIYILYLYYTYTNNSYPFWFLYKLNTKTIPFALKRSKTIQDKYCKLSANKKATFINNLFTSEEINFIFKPNNFPYDIDTNITHYVLWIRPGLNIDNLILINVIKNNIEIVFKKLYRFSFIKNCPANKSIPEIEHYHIFINYPCANN